MPAAGVFDFDDFTPANYIFRLVHRTLEIPVFFFALRVARTLKGRQLAAALKLQMTFSDYGLFGVRSKNYGWERRVWHRK